MDSSKSIKIFISLSVYFLTAALLIESVSIAKPELLETNDSTSNVAENTKHLLTAGWNRLAFNLKSKEGDIQFSTLAINNQLKDRLRVRCPKQKSKLRSRREKLKGQDYSDLIYDLMEEKNQPASSSALDTTKSKAAALSGLKNPPEGCTTSIGKPRYLKATNIYKLVWTVNNTRAADEMSLNDTLNNAVSKLKATLYTLGQLQTNN